MKSRVLRAAFLAIAPALMLTALVAVPAEAAPSVTLNVYHCTNSSCSSRTSVSSGPTNGWTQITASATTSGLLPPSLKSIEIDIKPASASNAVCFLRISNPGRGQTYTVTWNSYVYPSGPPSGCGSSSLYGSITRNEGIVVSATAVDSESSSNTSTARVGAGSTPLALNNPPAAPQWAASPTVSGASKNAPVVTLKWNANAEPDVQEYRFLRTDPAGNTKQYPVSAADPSAQGCSFDGSVYTCYDTDFPSTGFGGTYSYGLTVYRSSPSTADTCYFPDQQTPCIGTASSDVRTVSIVEPSPSPAASGGTGGTSGGTTGTGGGSGGGTGGAGSVPTGVPSVATPNQSQPRTAVQGQTFNPGDCFTCGTYKETLPYGSLPGDGQSSITVPGSGQGPIAAGAGIGSGSSGPDPRQLWVSVAAGLVLLLTAGHVARVLRTTAR